jgi:lysozyme family protein
MTLLSTLAAANAIRWGRMKLTRDFSERAKAILAGKARYQAVEARTKVPWWIIGVIHEREASLNWHTQLGQGDPLDRVSVHTPRGRGPFRTWEAGAYDALVNTAPYASKWRDFTPGGALCLLEQYNGTGYAARGEPSPYVFSGTNQYVRGKYVRDGVYDPHAVDHQLGCAGLIKTMMEFDPSIKFGGKEPAKPSIWSAILSFISFIFSISFRRK